MSVSDDRYAELMREILLSEPCRGVCSEPSRLLDHVYIGSQSNAESLRLLRQLGITHVLNCAGYKGPRPVPNASPYEGLGIDYYEFQAEDTDRYDICRHFPEAFHYLDRVKRQGGIALVHCALGINRSAAVCLGYLIIHSKIPLLQATRILKDKRRIALANRAFQRQLVRFARSRNLLDNIGTEENVSGSRADRISALLRSSRDELGGGSASLGRGYSRAFLLPDRNKYPSLSSSVPSSRYNATLPRRTCDTHLSRDWSPRWTDGPLTQVKSTRNPGCEDLFHSVNRRSSTDFDSTRGTGIGKMNDRIQPFTTDGPRDRRSRSTPRLINGSGHISPTAVDHRRLSSSRLHEYRH